VKLHLLAIPALFLSISEPAYATVIDLTDLSALPTGVKASGVIDDAGLTITVDGTINSLTVQGYLLVNDSPVDFGPLAYGVVYAFNPGLTIGEFELILSSNAPTVLDFVAAHYTGVHTINATDRFHDSALMYGLELFYGVPFSSIDIGYKLVSMDYTPTNVPEPSTLLLSGLGSLVWLSHRVYRKPRRKLKLRLFTHRLIQ
jgi:hypothetical protein